jgi:uncharacterized protein YdeI (YjbR/CyaY-like superfamily)
MADFSNLTRDRQPMPADVLLAMQASGVIADYKKRPAYQQNDYLAWIARAKRAATREKRIRQMLDELAKGGVYMNMTHSASAKTS